jgi:nicotinamidase-related amidase
MPQKSGVASEGLREAESGLTEGKRLRVWLSSLAIRAGRRTLVSMSPRLSFLIVAVALVSSGLAQEGTAFRWAARERAETAQGSGEFRVAEKGLDWNPRQMALVICDMWDTHTCPDSAARVAEMASRVNDFAKAARAHGVLIIHCPSDTMAFYQDHPGRKLAQAAPPATPPVPLQRWCALDRTREAALPIDDSDGGCDGERTWKKGDPYPWTRQHSAIEILDGDAITDSAEAYNLMRERGIENVLVCGVHLNMCVLGRPFAIRQMVQQGQRVALVRDLTDTMYNPARAPYVSHFAGTRLMVEHVEKYWCPTITSAALLGGEPFRFRGDQE